MVKHRLSVADRKTLQLMCHLASEWEASLSDAADPGTATHKWAASQRETVRRCLRNIKQFEVLTKKLLGESA